LFPVKLALFGKGETEWVQDKKVILDTKRATMGIQ